MHQRINLRVALALIGLGLSGFGLSACGFSPLYATKDNSQHINIVLEDIEIVAGGSRVSAQMHNELSDLINPNGPPANPKYQLVLDLAVHQSGQAFQIDASVTREEINIRAKYQLIELETNRSVLNRSRWARASLDVQENQYANLVSRENAVLRASRQLSETIKLDLSLFFDQPVESQATKIPAEG